MPRIRPTGAAPRHRFRAWPARDFQAAIGTPAGRRTRRIRSRHPSFKFLSSRFRFLYY
ncbi:hypothetical protein L522_3200 [Bordetella bronchiseptica MBORD707]|nr:hypothetical protein L522_3200 [Bordetella bronchiseptica MBORD707]